MRKLINSFLIISGVISISANSLLVVSCSGASSRTNEPSQDYYSQIYHNYYNRSFANPYNAFITKTINDLGVKATAESTKAFDELYDDSSYLSKPNVWNNYQDLAKTLTSTVLSSTVTTNVDWDALYTNKKVCWSPNVIDEARAEQLRFYNIFAKIYGKDNVLRLLQSVNFAPPEDKNVVAYTTYYPVIGSQTQTYGPNFVNMTMINKQYCIPGEQHWWTSHRINTVSTHEYGHALSNFLGATKYQRSIFNNYKVIPESNEFIKKASLVNSLQAKNAVLQQAKISDRAQALIDFIGDDAVQHYGIKLNGDVENFLFALYTVGSGYSQISWRDNDVRLRDEFFAEAFASWMLRRDDDGKDVGWNILNDFFMNQAPKYYGVSAN